jgi:hypothetical protein
MLSFDRIRAIGRRCLAVGIVLVVAGVVLRIVLEGALTGFSFLGGMGGNGPVVAVVGTVIDSLMLYAVVPAGALMTAAGVVLGWFSNTGQPDVEESGPAPAGSPASLVSGRYHIHSNPTQI